MCCRPTIYAAPPSDIDLRAEVRPLTLNIGTIVTIFCPSFFNICKTGTMQGWYCSIDLESWPSRSYAQFEKLPKIFRIKTIFFCFSFPLICFFLFLSLFTLFFHFHSFPSLFSTPLEKLPKSIWVHSLFNRKTLYNPGTIVSIFCAIFF